MRAAIGGNFAAAASLEQELATARQVKDHALEEYKRHFEQSLLLSLRDVHPVAALQYSFKRMHLAELKRRAEATFAETHEAIEQRRRIVRATMKHLAHVRHEAVWKPKAVSHGEISSREQPVRKV